MMSGVTKEFGQVLLDGARVPGDQIVGAPGEDWALTMSVVGHEREPSTLGISARYGKLVRELLSRAGLPFTRTRLGRRRDGDAAPARQAPDLRATRRRLARPEGSLDKLLMTWPLRTSLLLAKEYPLTGARIPAEKAVAPGLANHVVADPLAEATACAQRIAGRRRGAPNAS